MSTETPITDTAESLYLTQTTIRDPAVILECSRNLELENTRLAGEVERLTRERDEAKHELREDHEYVSRRMGEAVALVKHLFPAHITPGVLDIARKLLDSSVNPPHRAPPNGIF